LRINWYYIKMLLIMCVMVFLYAFASQRNAVRNISSPNIEFTGENNLFITRDNVSKLLIQNNGGEEHVLKEVLDLNHLEGALRSNPMIKSAEVYVSVNGKFSAKVNQKTPIARVNASVPYYVDDEGGYMPLSRNYSARVPLVTGYVDQTNLKNIFAVAKKIREDAFLKKHVVEIQQNTNKKLFLKLRQCNFLVQLGTVSALDKKINNLKAFYIKSLKENTLQNYKKVNLQFDNQVVCSK